MTTCLATYLAEKRRTLTHHGHLLVLRTTSARSWTGAWWWAAGSEAGSAGSRAAAAAVAAAAAAASARRAAVRAGARRAKGQAEVGCRTWREAKGQGETEEGEGEGGFGEGGGEGLRGAMSMEACGRVARSMGSAGEGGVGGGAVGDGEGGARDIATEAGRENGVKGGEEVGMGSGAMKGRKEDGMFWFVCAHISREAEEAEHRRVLKRGTRREWPGRREGRLLWVVRCMLYVQCLLYAGAQHLACSQ